LTSLSKLTPFFWLFRPFSTWATRPFQAGKREPSFSSFVHAVDPVSMLASAKKTAPAGTALAAWSFVPEAPVPAPERAPPQPASRAAQAVSARTLRKGRRRTAMVGV
jgi:hypothetical protein